MRQWIQLPPLNYTAIIDVVEKAFGNLKERLNMRRAMVSSEQSLEGKLFVQFVALIYLSLLYRLTEMHLRILI